MDRAKSECVSIRGLSLAYRSGLFGRSRVHAVRDLELTVAPGESVAVVGPNGSGKSSLLRTLLGLERPSFDSMTVLGEPPGHRASLRRIGYVAEGRLPLGRLTATEFLTLCGTLAGFAPKHARLRAGELLDLVDLGAVRDRPHGPFSTGMERRLAFAAALYHEPALLALDEPTSGMDALGVEIVRKAVAERVAAGAGALIATHDVDKFGDRGFDRLHVLLAGRTVASGTPDEILGVPILGVPESRELRVSGLSADDVDSFAADARSKGGTVESLHRERRPLGELLFELQERHDAR